MAKKINYAAMYTLRKEKDKGYSYKHAATLKSIYKQVLDYAIIKKYIHVNPAVSVKVPRGMKRGKREAPEDEIVKNIKANLDKPFGDFVAVLLYTGMRTEEAAALQWGDVDKKNIYIRRAADLHGTPKIKETKTDAGDRAMPIFAPLKPFLTTITSAFHKQAPRSRRPYYSREVFCANHRIICFPVPKHKADPKWP